MQLRLVAPPRQPPRPYCSGHDRFCASYTQRLSAGDGPLTTAAEARLPRLQASAALPRGGAARHAGLPLSLGASTLVAMALARRVMRPRPGVAADG